MQSRFGPKHPSIIEIEDQIQMYRDKMAKPGPNSTISAEKKVMPLDSVEAVVAALESEISSDDALLKELDDMYDQQTKIATRSAIRNFKMIGCATRFSQSRQLLDSITKKLAEITLAKDFGGYEARKIAPASFARKVSPNALVVFPISAFAGLLIGLSLAYLAEMSDKSFRTPAEIRRRLGLPVIGHIPFFSPDEKAQKQIAAGEPAVDPMLCTHYASNSVSSEAYRSVRTASTSTRTGSAIRSSK